jgi:ABC-type polysaccharide/polyol phosphate transport system ATPase subunit
MSFHQGLRKVFAFSARSMPDYSHYDDVMLSPFLIQTHALTHGPIHNLSFSWPAGVSWICGDEGTGKTTLLRLLAGDVQPLVGTVMAPEGGVFWVDLQNKVHDTTTVQAQIEAAMKTYGVERGA